VLQAHLEVLGRKEKWEKVDIRAQLVKEVLQGHRGDQDIKEPLD
jgi:hypothetical protein